MNVFTFTGNLGRDSELRYTQSSTAVLSFSVAASAGYGDKKQTIWVDCSMFGQRAESRIKDYLLKGQQVAVSGELSTREYEGKTYIQCRVNDVTLIGKRDDSGSHQPRPAARQQPPPTSGALMDDDDDIPF